MSIKSKIICVLLEFGSLSTPQLSEKCGYSSSDIDNIHSALLELESEGYFNIKMGKSDRGRKPKIYSLKRNFEVIKQIFENFKDIEENVQKTEWVLDEIIKNKISISDIEVKNEIKNMLTKSPHFFRLTISQPNVMGMIEKWNAINNVLLPIDSSESSDIIDQKSRLYLQFSDFFAYCVFTDIFNNELIHESWNYLQELRQRTREYNQNIDEYLQSYQSMYAIMYTLTNLHKIVTNEVFVDGNTPELNQLMAEITKYSLIQERMNSIDFRDIDLEQERIRIYEKILYILSMDRSL